MKNENVEIFLIHNQRKELFIKRMELWQMKSNRHHSEDQAQHQPLRPDTGGTGRGERHFKQGNRCYKPEGYTLDEKDEKQIASMTLRN